MTPHDQSTTTNHPKKENEWRKKDGRKWLVGVGYDETMTNTGSEVQHCWSPTYWGAFLALICALIFELSLLFWLTQPFSQIPKPFICFPKHFLMPLLDIENGAKKVWPNIFMFSRLKPNTFLCLLILLWKANIITFSLCFVFYCLSTATATTASLIAMHNWMICKSSDGRGHPGTGTSNCNTNALLEVFPLPIQAV